MIELEVREETKILTDRRKVRLQSTCVMREVRSEENVGYQLKIKERGSQFYHSS